MRYFNPAQSRSVSILPDGRHASTKHVAMFQEKGYGDANEDGTPWDGNCAPKCTWQCKHIECEKECKPVCDMPKCQTRCKKVPDMSDCSIKCSNKPRCATFCPPQKPCDKFDKNGRRMCQKPDCATKCERAQCFMICGGSGDRVCKNVCAEPNCKWQCSNPKVCPKPLCRLTCERPNCTSAHQTFDLPKIEDNVTVMTNFTAREAPSFEVGPWSECDCATGKQYRDVRCSNSLDVCGPGETPHTSRVCPIPCQGRYDWGEWTPCRGNCFSHGYQSRVGHCVMGFCNGVARKEEIRRCEFDSPRCHMCEVEVFGGPFWDGWSQKFQPGSYDEVDFRKRNMKCEDISSMQVKGHCCAVRLYQYGGFNEKANPEKSWKVLYPEGNYNKEDLEEKGGLDNEGSSMDVFVDEHCKRAHMSIAEREHGVAFQNGATSLTALLALFVAVLAQ